MRLPEVLRLCSFSRSTLYDKIAKGLFPKQVRLGENIVAWYESEVLAWIRRPT
jgi:prophage regulatory protein